MYSCCIIYALYDPQIIFDDKNGILCSIRVFCNAKAIIILITLFRNDIFITYAQIIYVK